MKRAGCTGSVVLGGCGGTGEIGWSGTCLAEKVTTEPNLEGGE